MSEHYLTQCGYCGTIYEQCRCPEKDKTVNIGVCDSCYLSEGFKDLKKINRKTVKKEKKGLIYERDTE